VREVRTCYGGNNVLRLLILSVQATMGLLCHVRSSILH
jgi:hypothetical protein